MIPGPYQIISCQYCEGLAKYRTLTSGNTLRATFWSDGKNVSPMLPQPPIVVKCQHCEKCYWLADAEKVGTVDLWAEEEQKVNPEWAAVKQVKEPTEDEYYSAIEANLAKDGGQEKILRVLAWWRRNDAFRDVRRTTGEVMVSVSGACGDNLEALLKLIDQEKDEDRIMKGEILRELGQFDAAKQVLGSVSSDQYSFVVRQSLSLCANEDNRVFGYTLVPRKTTWAKRILNIMKRRKDS